MFSVVLAGLATQDEPRVSRRSAPLLEPACRLLARTPPALASATHISMAVSAHEAADFALQAARLAADYGLISTVDIQGNRLHVTFVRHDRADGEHAGG